MQKVEDSAFDELNKRGSDLLKTGNFSDCRFLVGTDDNKRTITAHKQILAMGSPVFERMFYGDLGGNDDPIEIIDIQPDAFMAMLEYIYAHRITVESFDRACSLCYLAEKYMLTGLFKTSLEYIMKNLKPSTACRTYEFAKLLNNSKLLAKSMEIIKKQTRQVLSDQSFIDIEPSTLLDILEQKELNATEVELFKALVQYTNATTDNNDASKFQLFKNLSLSKDEPSDEGVEKCRETIIRQAVKKIRYLTMTPNEFVDVVSCSNLLTENEAYLILRKISSPMQKGLSMPDGFQTETQNRVKRRERIAARAFCADHGIPFCYTCSEDGVFAYMHHSETSIY